MSRKTPLTKKYLRGSQVDAVYGISLGKLRKLRNSEIGLEFRRIGYRSYLYSVESLERFLANAPSRK